MLNLRHLTDETLIAETLRLAREEREILTAVLSHLHEIERRRLFCTDHCESMQDYAMKKFGYSRDEANRRVQAMRAIQGVPEVETKIASGELALTHINSAQTLFRNEERAGREMTLEKKAEVFEAISGLTTREAEKVLFGYSAEPPPPPECFKAIGKDLNQLLAGFSDDTRRKLEQLKGLRAHEKINFDRLINELCDVGAKDWNPATPTKVRRSKESKAEIRRQIWKRDRSQCTQCGSHHAVQEDHIVCRSMGGEYTLENMRLLCRNCNQRAAIEKLGIGKMDPYLSSAAPR